jgi:hypothetical protein
VRSDIQTDLGITTLFVTLLQEALSSPTRSQ